jgi:prepilin-type processing-associated H-X9-DG protein
VGTYAGGKPDLLSTDARTPLFACPSSIVPNKSLRLNFGANPNICREVTATKGPAAPDEIKRPSESIVIGDAIQYTPDGDSHAILWGVLGSNGTAIYWNNGLEANADSFVPVGEDTDKVLNENDPAGSNFRYRHGGLKQINAWFADGHVQHVTKGKIKDRHLYTNY